MIQVNTLLDIWRDYRDETTGGLNQKSFPEPPVFRDRLRQEICFFVESIREKADEHGQ